MTVRTFFVWGHPLVALASRSRHPCHCSPPAEMPTGAVLLSKTPRRPAAVSRFRVIAWVVGLIGVVALAYVLPWSESWREAGPLALVLALALIGLVAELAAL